MTLAQFVEVVRRRHRAESDSNWSDAEIYQLLTGRINEVLGIVGLLEGTDTSNTTVASTQAYNLPTDCTSVRIVTLDGEQLQEINFRDWELQKAGGTTPEGKPIQYVVWNRQLLLVPIPSTAGDTITIYYYKWHPYIDNVAQTTIDLDAVLHWRLADAVIGDMFQKDLNQAMASFYEDKWLNVHIPAIQWYARRSKRGGRVKTILDSDSHPVTDRGMY